MMVLVWNMPTSALDDVYSALLTAGFVAWAVFTPVLALTKHARPRPRRRRRSTR